MLGYLYVMVEEPSMEAALDTLLPKILGNIDYQSITFQCKDDLLKNLPARLLGYRRWLPKNHAIMVLVDCDDDDCIELKNRLERIALDAGMITKSGAVGDNRFQVVNRIVVEELESWFFGDWHAVRTAYPRLSPHVPTKRAYRDPDQIAGGTWEALERLMKGGQYYPTGLRKVELARSIAMNMDPNNNRSRSFNDFKNALDAAMAWK